MLMPLPGLRRFTHLLYAVSALGLGSGALAQNAKPLAGTQINVVLRSLPETDYITPQIPKFEESTGIKVQVISFPENQLRDKLVQDLSA